MNAAYRAVSAALFAALCGISATSARAQPNTWSIAGAGCVPTGQTASTIGTFNSAGDAKFAVGRVGEIILTCPVPSSLASAAVFAMTYRDPDGFLPRTRVRAVLRQKELATGAVSDVAWATLDSNSRAPNPANQRIFANFPSACTGTAFSFDHRRFTYYVQVNMNRTAVSGDVLLASVDFGTELVC